MSYCINPRCPHPDDPSHASNKICCHCGTELLVQGRYQVMRLLSDKSGFGKIYEAFEGAKPKILKVLKEELNKNNRAVELFKQEAIVLGQINHPGIPQVDRDGYFQFFPKDSPEPLHCLVMEKIEGSNLRQWMSQHQHAPISEQQAINWLQQLAEILHAVHQKNYFHRDIKPENIMMRSNGQLVLIDFGTAREMTYTYLAEVGSAGITKISSPGYTPPEQEKGHAIPQSDFYALGRTFVYLLTGKQLTNTAIYNPLTDEFHWRQRAPQISPQLADFIDKLMSPQAAKRPKDTEEILEDLAALSGGYATTSLPATIADATIIPSSSTQTQVTLVKPKRQLLLKSVFLLLLALGGWGIWQVFQRPINLTSNIVVEKTISGHSSYINYIVMSPDGQRLISASADKTIKIWDLAGGKEIRTLEGHSSYVNYLAISPDGQILASASADKTIKIWRLSDGKILHTLTGHGNFVNALAIASDGQTLASASADKTIKIWRLSDGRELRTLTGHSAPVNAVAISADGELIISGSADKTIKLWRLSDGRELRTLTGHSAPVNTVAISADGELIISGSADKTIKLWPASKSKEVRTLSGHANAVNYVAISPDGQKLISASADKTIKLWDAASGREIKTLTGYNQWINYLAIAPDWQTVATGSGAKKIYIFRLPQ